MDESRTSVLNLIFFKSTFASHLHDGDNAENHSSSAVSALPCLDHELKHQPSPVLVRLSRNTPSHNTLLRL